jgi:hypothetical protein
MKTTATTETLSSPAEKKAIGASNGVETPPAPGKNRGRARQKGL